MALEDLLTALEGEAAAETERLQSEAEAEASRIVASAELEARAIEEQAARADEADFSHALERRRAEARLVAAAELRDVYEAGMETLRSALRARLETIRDGEGYRAVLRALIAESLGAVPSASLMRVDPRDAQLAQSILDELDAQIELRADLETTGGVELVADDGRTVVNTFEERLRNAEEPLRILAGEFLAPTAPTAGQEL
jgi:V/A-type H+-transporting ATPase subunit E